MERYQLSAAILSFLLLVVLTVAFSSQTWGYVGETIAGTASLSFQMFNPGGYGLTFLLLAVLLTSSMIGGVYLAKEE